MPSHSRTPFVAGAFIFCAAGANLPPARASPAFDADSAAAAAALSTIFSAPALAQDQGRAWWALGESSGTAPNRTELYVDWNSIVRQGNTASAHAILVFEQVQDGGIKAFEATYDFRCAERQQRRRDAVFIQADGRHQPSVVPTGSWQPVEQGSAAQTVFDRACNRIVPAGSTGIAGTPLEAAERVFGLERGMARWDAQLERADPVTRRLMLTVRCRGHVYVDRAEGATVGVYLALNDGRLTVEFTPDNWSLSGRYSFELQPTGAVRINMANANASFDAGGNSFSVTFRYTWDDQQDPRNPFPDWQSSDIDYRATCS